MFWLCLLDEYQQLFGHPHCPKCKQDFSNNAVTQSTLCANCCQSLAFHPHASQPWQNNITVWQVFNWNRRLKRLWYGVKFYKRYGYFFLLETALKQAVEAMKLHPPLHALSLYTRPIWVVHPPFKEGKLNLFAPLLFPLCRTNGWVYMPDAFILNPQASLQKALHHSSSRQERQRLIQDRFLLNPKWLKILKQAPQAPFIIVFDDFMTTGSTLNACFTLLQDALSSITPYNLQTLDDDPQVYDKITKDSSTTQLLALVLTSVPS